MATDIKIRTWVRATAAEEQTGLLGYLSIFYVGIVLDGLTVRRTLDGRLTLSFPERRDGQGRRHPIARPVDDESRRAIEAAVFGAATLSREVRP